MGAYRSSLSINDWSTKSWNLYATHRRLVPEDFDDEGKDDQEKLSQVVKMDFPDRLFVVKGLCSRLYQRNRPRVAHKGFIIWVSDGRFLKTFAKVLENDNRNLIK